MSHQRALLSQLWMYAFFLEMSSRNIWIFALIRPSYASRRSRAAKRLSFSLTPLIVVGLATAFLGRFRRSVFLLSLICSLSTAIFYYVAQMLASLAAMSGIVSPVGGLWSVIAIFAIAAFISYLTAKT